MHFSRRYRCRRGFPSRRSLSMEQKMQAFSRRRLSGRETQTFCKMLERLRKRWPKTLPRKIRSCRRKGSKNALKAKDSYDPGTRNDIITVDNLSAYSTLPRKETMSFRVRGMSDAYTKAGVNRDTENETKKEMASALETTDKRVLNKIGAFATLFDGSFPEYRHPVLVLKTEEPGTKQLLAFKYDSIETICQDLINHLVNDAIVMGARPLSIQDCIICGKIEKPVVVRMVQAFALAAKDNE